MPLSLFIFVQHLTTGTAGRRLATAPLSIHADNGNSLIVTHLWILSRRCEDSRALGTEARRISGVLLIAAANHSAIGHQHRGTHMKLRIRRISPHGSLKGMFQQFSVFALKCFHRVEFLIANSKTLVHIKPIEVAKIQKNPHLAFFLYLCT